MAKVKSLALTLFYSGVTIFFSLVKKSIF